MLPPELLSESELAAVTKYRARARQCAALDQMGVPYIRRRDGLALVRRDLRAKSATDVQDGAQARLGHTTGATTRRHYVREVDWSEVPLARPGRLPKM